MPGASRRRRTGDPRALRRVVRDRDVTSAGSSAAGAAPPLPMSAPGGGLFRLALIGALTVVLTLATPFAFRAGGDNLYMAFAVATGLIAMAATVVAERTHDAKALWLIIGIAVGLRIILLLLDPLLSTDIYRYVWDGKVQAAGLNPYRYVPADPALAALRDAAIYPNINRVDTAVTAYPPVAQMFFLAATRFGANVTAMRLALLACEAATVALIILMLRRLGRPATRVVAYLWHPLPMWEIANSGHVDGAMVALIMLGLWLAVAGRRLPGAISIALGALIKPYAVLALAAAWRPWDWKMPLAVLAVVALCYAPYLSVGWGVFGFLTTGYLQEEAYNTGAYFWPLAAIRWLIGTVPGDVVAYEAAAALAIGALALRTAWRNSQSIETVLPDVSTLLLTSMLLLSPNYPWYFLILTPFVALVGGAPLWAVTIGAIFLQQEAMWGPVAPLLVRKSALYGFVILAFGYSAWRARRERRIVSPQC